MSGLLSESGHQSPTSLFGVPAYRQIGVGWTREDEDGWFIVDRRELDDDVDGFWVMDKHGEEHFVAAAKMGDNWKAPAEALEDR